MKSTEQVVVDLAATVQDAKPRTNAAVRDGRAAALEVGKRTRLLRDQGDGETCEAHAVFDIASRAGAMASPKR